jgi:hypothetical protein
MKNKFTLNLKFFFIIAFVLLAKMLAAQTTGDYRSNGAVSWATTASWQRWNGTSWVSAVVAPSAATFTNNTITVQVGNALLVTANTTANYASVTSGNTLVIAGSATVENTANATTTFLIAGTLQVDGAITIGASGNNHKSLLSVTGTVVFSSLTQQITFINSGGSGSSTFTLGAAATLKTKNTAGVLGTNCSISTAIGTTNLPVTASYEFNGSANQTTVGLPATVNDLTLSGSNTKTLSAATVVNGTLLINSGVTLATANLALTLGADFVNSGVITAGSSAITILGTLTQNIAGFTTTGAVSMTKTAGTATFTGNVNGGALTINGTGGTLNLGSGLTHIFTGAWIRTAGTLNGGSSLLKIGTNISGTGGTFTANAGTVEWNAAGAQTIASVTYNNLILSGSGAKSITSGTTVVSGNLSISGTALASLANGLNMSVGSLTLGGVNKVTGTWGSTGSTATHQDNTYFSVTTGFITVSVDTRLTPVFSGLTASSSIVYGTNTVTLSGTVSASGPVYPDNGETVSVTINGVTQNAVISGGAGVFSVNFISAAIPVTGGPFTITYAYSGGNNLKAATSNTSTSLTVTPRTLIIAATDVNKTYGATLTGGSGSSAFSTVGLQNGETAGTVTITYGTGAAATVAAGTYNNTVTPSAATGGTITAANYAIIYSAGSIIVGAKALTITANNQTKNYGTTFTFTGNEFTSSGLINSDAVSGVTLTSSGAIAAAPVSGSPYSIVPSAATGTGLTNYTITYANGILTISPILVSAADFRSKAAGNFSSAANWEYDQGGGSWANATAAPASTNNITITHAIALDQNFTEGAGKTLLINPGGSVIINPGFTLSVASTGTIDFNGQPVIVQSNAGGTGSIGVVAGTLSGATNVTTERFIGTNTRAWRLLTIPVTGQTIRQAWCGVNANPAAPAGESAGVGTLITGNGYATGAAAVGAGFDWFTNLGTTTTSSIRTYNPVTNNWFSVNTPDPLSAPTQQGYMLYVRGDRTVVGITASGTTTLRPAGTLNQGTQTISVSSPFAVVGNPYASSIDLDAVYNNSGNSSVINRNFWLWDATQGTSGAYNNISYSGPGLGYLSNTTGGDGTPFLTVNSGQAFIVQQNGGGGVSLTIEETNKSSATPPVLFRPMGNTGSGVSNLSIKLYDATGSVLGKQDDGVVARYNPIYNVSPTESYDVAKFNNFNENLSLVRDNRYLSVESRPFPTQSDTLFVPFWNLKVRDYALSIASSNFAGINQTAVLIDRFTNTQKVIDLGNATITYPFSITSNPASSSLNRFLIVLSPSAPLAVKFTKINALPAGNNVMVNWSVGSEQGIKNYEVEKSTDGSHFTKSGTILANGLTAGANYQWADDQVAEGNNYYRIRSNEESGTFGYSSVVMVQWKGKKGIQVYPTLITNKQFTLSLSNQPLGNYIVSLTDASGQQVFIKTITNAGGNNKQVITLNKATVPAGVYNLSVSNETGIKQNFRIAFN